MGFLKAILLAGGDFILILIMHLIWELDLEVIPMYLEEHGSLRTMCLRIDPPTPFT